MTHPDLLEGHGRFSDAGVFRVRPDLALVQTVDFFPPIVDDPRDFGRIAAANSLSDCYAMGGKAATVLAVAGFPAKKLPTQVLGEIFAGGAEKVIEAGAVILGGHTVEDTEIKYGLSVTGTVHPDQYVSNSGAKPGDALVLTKPLGMGTISTAINRGKISDELTQQAVDVMSTLNKDASESMIKVGTHGCTDITGFGLLGHAYEMATASEVTLRIHSGEVPLMPEVKDLAARGLLSGGVERNRAYVGEHVAIAEHIDSLLVSLFLDSETSGGLLISLPPKSADTLIEWLRDKDHEYVTKIGEVEERGEKRIYVE